MSYHLRDSYLTRLSEIDMFKYIFISILTLTTSLSALSQEEVCPEEVGLCRDGTYSHTSDLRDDCGQLALANTLSMLCSTSISPYEVHACESDLTPGTRAQTMLNIANQILSTHSSCSHLRGKKLVLKNYRESTFMYHLKHELTRRTGGRVGIPKRVQRKTTGCTDPHVFEYDHPHHISEQDLKWYPTIPAHDCFTFENITFLFNPLIVPIVTVDGYAHYVTVIDITEGEGQCYVHVNDYGRQRVIDCETFTKRASMSTSVFGRITQWSTGQYGIFHLN
jgi:hypothetical protein